MSPNVYFYESQRSATKWSAVGFSKVSKPAEPMRYLIEHLCPKDGLVVDPFLGSGISAIEAAHLKRRFVGVDINPAAVRIARLLLSPPAALAAHDAFTRVSALVRSEILDSYALFKQDRLSEICADAVGKRFLKLRSLNRTEHLERLFRTAGIAQPDVGARQWFETAFDSEISTATIEACIREIYLEEREQRRAKEAELVNQLCRVQEFNWGGLHQNSLEKTIVDNYVKKITDYEALCRYVENELLVSMRGYVVCSW